jgi:hypothetical protein
VHKKVRGAENSNHVLLQTIPYKSPGSENICSENTTYRKCKEHHHVNVMYNTPLLPHIHVKILQASQVFHVRFL